MMANVVQEGGVGTPERERVLAGSWRSGAALGSLSSVALPS